MSELGVPFCFQPAMADSEFRSFVGADSDRVRITKSIGNPTPCKAR